MPAQATLFNVSALVLPAPGPVFDDGRQEQQLPMFEDAKLLLRALADVAATLRENARVQRGQQEFLTQQIQRLRHVEVAEPDAEERPSHPTNSRWRTWRGFVLDLQALEKRVPRHGKITKARLAMLGPDSARTITRTMEGYGLRATDWPPSTWDPDQERVYQPKKRRKATL